MAVGPPLVGASSIVMVTSVPSRAVTHCWVSPTKLGGCRLPPVEGFFSIPSGEQQKKSFYNPIQQHWGKALVLRIN